MKKSMFLFLFVWLSLSNVFAVDKYEGFDEMYNLIENFLQNGTYIKQSKFYSENDDFLVVSFLNRNSIKEICFRATFYWFEEYEYFYIPQFYFVFVDGSRSDYFDTNHYSIVLDDKNNLVITETNR